MKILIIMDPGILVPPIGYGGHERLVEMFAKEYRNLGHEIHLLVTKGSEIPGCITYSIGRVGFPPKKIVSQFAILKAWFFLWRNKNKYDLVHNFGRLAYLLPILNHDIKKIMTYGREIHAPNIKIINQFRIRNLIFTAPSEFCKRTGNVSGNWKTVFNAIEFNRYDLNKTVSSDAPLIFLSRLERLKGAHEAVEIALITGEKLIIAGNISKLPEEKEYFRNKIEPFIDGEQIKYVGVLNDEQKNVFLGKSKAMLFPARTEEAFGLVMVESMACGTPVIAYNYAAMPEVVDHGITGFIVSNKMEMADKIKMISELDREKCRRIAEVRFDVKKVAKDYLSLFE